MNKVNALPWSLLPKMMYKSLHIFYEKKDYIDSINVFPVPDGDTGINMYLTLKTIADNLEKVELENHESISEAISQGAFMGAKGNSGTILSQFLRGWINHLKKAGQITPNSFAGALDTGQKKAYSAVMTPKEGTMLTIFREIAKFASQNTHLAWLDFIHGIFEVSQETTLKTREMMDVLKKGGVVDSGALGVVYILQGWAITIEEYVTKDSIEEHIISGLENLETHIDIEKVEEETNHRYCTEVLINSSTPLENLRSKFSSKGSFFMLTEHGGLVKIHIHTDRPNTIIRDFSNFGMLEQLKIDDMVSQAQYFRT